MEIEGLVEVGMGRRIEGYDRRQSFVLPACVDDYVDESSPVRAIESFVDELDLADLGFVRAVPAETGRPSYHPATLLKLYLNGYLTRTRHSFSKLFYDPVAVVTA